MLRVLRLDVHEHCILRHDFLCRAEIRPQVYAIPVPSLHFGPLRATFRFVNGVGALTLVRRSSVRRFVINGEIIADHGCYCFLVFVFTTLKN